jgi:hypothetical protein
MNLLYPTLLAILGQLITFTQLQIGSKLGWYDKYPIFTILLSIPSGWCYIKSVDAYIKAFEGNLWPSRLIGFGIGTIVFTILSILIFNETMSIKTSICLLLASVIILIQIFWV